MGRLKNIMIGWGKHWGILPVSEAEKKLSALRLSICAGCPLHTTSKLLEFMEGGRAEYVQTIFCTKCKCPAPAKTIVVGEHCPVKKW